MDITRKAELNRVEAALLKRAVDVSIRTYGPRHRFTASDICQMHKMWLGSVYAWAGMYRRVNMTNGEFLFAAAAQIPALMRELEQGPLRRYTPCRFTSAGRGGEELRADEIVKLLPRSAYRTTSDPRAASPHHPASLNQ